MNHPRRTREAPFEEPSGEPVPLANPVAEPCPSEAPIRAPEAPERSSPSECPTPAN